MGHKKLKKLPKISQTLLIWLHSTLLFLNKKYAVWSKCVIWYKISPTMDHDVYETIVMLNSSSQDARKLGLFSCLTSLWLTTLLCYTETYLFRYRYKFWTYCWRWYVFPFQWIGCTDKSFSIFGWFWSQ